MKISYRSGCSGGLLYTQYVNFNIKKDSETITLSENDFIYCDSTDLIIHRTTSEQEPITPTHTQIPEQESITPTPLPKPISNICNKGLRFIRYNDEISFTNENESKIVETPNFYLDKKNNKDQLYEYDSIIIEGYYCPSFSGNATIEFQAKPRGELIIKDKKINSLGTAGWCTDGAKESVTYKYDFIENECVYMKISYRSGCSGGLLYTQYVNFNIKKDSETITLSENDFIYCDSTDLIIHRTTSEQESLTSTSSPELEYETPSISINSTEESIRMNSSISITPSPGQTSSTNPDSHQSNDQNLNNNDKSFLSTIKHFISENKFYVIIIGSVLGVAIIGIIVLALINNDDSDEEKSSAPETCIETNNSTNNSAIMTDNNIIEELEISEENDI